MMKERNRLARTYKGKTAYGWSKSAVVTAMNSGLAEICVYVPDYGTVEVTRSSDTAPVPYLALTDYSGALATLRMDKRAEREIDRLVIERDALQSRID